MGTNSDSWEGSLLAPTWEAPRLGPPGKLPWKPLPGKLQTSPQRACSNWALMALVRLPRRVPSGNAQQDREVVGDAWTSIEQNQVRDNQVWELPTNGMRLFLRSLSSGTL